MAIAVHCGQCGKTMKVKDSSAGQRGLCPFCKAEILVPAAVVPPIPSPAPPVDKAAPVATKKSAGDFKPPTEKQLNYAHNLGVEVPDGIDRRELSRMIAIAEKDAPASAGQRDFLRELGVTFKDDIRSSQASALIDASLDLRDQVQAGIHQQLKDAGFLVDSATELQLLQELQHRGKPFFIFTLDNDEFRYQESLPISGQLQWSDDLNVEDVQWILINMVSGWAKGLNLPKYSDEFDGTPPSLEFTARELPTDAANVVHLDVNLNLSDDGRA